MSEVKVPDGYKQTEIGVIPEDWGSIKVQDVCDFIVPGRNKPQKFDGDIPWITTPDLIDGRAVFFSRSGLKISKEVAKTVGSKIVPAGSVIMSCVGELGLVAIAGVNIVINQQLHAFLPSKKIDNYFLMYALKDQENYFHGAATKTALPYLNKDNCNATPLPLPSIQEQTAIATALSDVDNLIGSLEKLIAKKEAIKTGTMQQLLTGKTRLPEFATREDGSAKGFKQTELGRIPEDWDLVELRDLLSYEQPTKYIIDGNEFLEDGTTPVLTAGKSFILGYTEEAHGIYRSLPTIIFDDFTTATQFVNFPFKVKSSAMKILKPKSTSVPIQLIYLLLSNIDYKVGDHKRHWISEFSSLKVRLPNSSIEQNAIATILSDMDAEIQALQQRLEKTRDIKQGMMQQLLTGKVRLAH